MYVSLFVFSSTYSVNKQQKQTGGVVSVVKQTMPFGAYLENTLWPIVRLILLPCFDPLTTTVQSNARVSSTIGS